MPPELESVLFNPDVVEGTVAVLVGVLALLAAIIGLGVKKLSDMKKATEEVKETATATKEQVTNNHSTNFRDDVTGLAKTLDALSDTVNEGFRRMYNQFGEKRIVRWIHQTCDRKLRTEIQDQTESV